ncbi:glycoside hydrolase superfamily [Lentinula edodes]|uniref:glycoside hydrolase superfamily n=1 Tax=Lentinula edodes TaxID=5353 RepID=UPI001E8EBE19|nr:glycoside hydrolase superfamily [Lentinula edodes]KAH7873319.1 glycoside hydrolase superfamily [Lentinula edodes]
MSPSRITILFLAAAVTELSHAATLISADSPLTDVNVVLPPADNAVTISPSFVSLSIEQDRWTDWSGTTSSNQFFYNAMENLKNLSGSPPGIRIGANSEDHTNFDHGVQYAEDIFPAPNPTTPYPEATNITVGDSYYTTAKYLLPDTEVIWGVNFGQNNLTAAIVEATSIMQAFSGPEISNLGISLKFLEIGNEPDLYMNNGLRPKNYNVTQYVSEWTHFADAIFQEIKLNDTSTRFLAGAFAGSSSNLEGFSPQAIFNLGISNSLAGQYIEAFSEHHYQGTFCSGSEGVLSDLMSKANIRGNLSQYASDIQATNDQGFDYILGETNSYSCHGAPGVSNTAGAAIWALDYALYSATLGIKQVYFHDGIGFKYNLIQPLTLTRSILDGSPLSAPLSPHIQPQYYAGIVAAEAIGRYGNTLISELPIDNPQISGYSFYDDSQVKRLVLINHTPYFQADATAGTQRPVAKVKIYFPDRCGTQNIVAKMLEIQHSDDTSGLTWGGQSYETSDGLIGGFVSARTVASNEYLGIPASQAALVAFQCS